MKKLIEITGINLNEKQIGQFEKYFELLIEKNKVMNLTAITDREEVIKKHFADSLTCIKVVDFNKVMNLIDVGTGAGFPGIPIKIAFPELEVVLMDSLNKRVEFLNLVIEELGLDKISAIHDRAEDLGRRDGFREEFDLCVSRAVANLSVLSEICIPFVKVGGTFLSYKSGKISQEIEEAETALSVLGGKVEKIEKFNLSGTDAQRSLIVVKKISITPDKYPRKAGKITKTPIK